MASLNSVHILGNLGKDPELRYTSNETAVCNMSIATKEFKKGANGERQDYTEWHRIVVWDKLAENCSKYLKKGSSALVIGRNQTRSWEDNNGIKRYITEVVSNNVQFLNSSAETSKAASNDKQIPQDSSIDENIDIPF